MTNKSSSMVLVKPNQFEHLEIDIPQIGSQYLLLEVEMVGICGTDKSIYLGKHEQKHYPMLMGHEVVGRVALIGDDAKENYNVNVGDRVTVEPFISCKKCDYCLNGHYQLCENKTCYGLTQGIDKFPYLNGAYSQYLFVQPNSKLHIIKEEIPSRAACMSSVIGNGVRWVITKGKTKPGDTVTIIGPGAQGLASTIAAKAVGAETIIVIGLEQDREKLTLAKELGATHTIIMGSDDVVSEVKAITKSKLSDVVIDCTGAESVLGLSTDLVRPLGKVIVIGKNGGKSIPLQTDKVVNKEIEIIGGYGQAGDMEYAVEIINSNQYQVEKIVSHTFPLKDAKQAMNLFINHPDQCIRVSLKP